MAPLFPRIGCTGLSLDMAGLSKAVILDGKMLLLIFWYREAQSNANCDFNNGERRAS